MIMPFLPGKSMHLFCGLQPHVSSSIPARQRIGEMQSKRLLECPSKANGLLFDTIQVGDHLPTQPSRIVPKSMITN